MKTTRVLILTVATVLVIGLFSSYGYSEPPGLEKKRVIAHSPEEVSAALDNGCQIVREVGSITALICRENVAKSLNLSDDVIFHAVDTRANTGMNVDPVHEEGKFGSGVVVAVIDSGTDCNHQELSEGCLGGYDFVNNDSDPFDDDGHGTHVSGIIKAKGIVPLAQGVAMDSRILPLKVLDQNGSGYFSDIVAAINWILEYNETANENDKVKVINMSIGTSPPYTYGKFCNTVLPALYDIIQQAKNAGIIVIVAAGNEGRSGVGIPGCYDISTTVAAVDFSDKIASFSSRGKAVDISAYGVGVYSSLPGNNYAYWSGTSMATPNIAGVAALLIADNPGLTPGEIEDAIFNTADDLGKRGKDNSYGNGLVNAFGAINYNSDTDPPEEPHCPKGKQKKGLC